MTIIISGTARSGSSIISGIVDILGIKMLTEIPKPHQLKQNPKGMFEHSAAINLACNIALNRHLTTSKNY